MSHRVETARLPFVDHVKVLKRRRTCFGRLSILVRIIPTQEVAEAVAEDTRMEEGINKVVIIKINNNHMGGINLKEVINSNRSTVKEEEATVKIPVMVVAPPNPNHISSKATSNKALLKVAMELHRAPHLCRNGRLQQHPMVKHTTTMKDRERRPGKSPRECHKGHREVVKKRFPLPLDLFDEDVFCLT
mmetsp:Transcript_492/g.930  ORF Transcript_492/g.930 Transcript_492/m.930 type:complete len:189 (+) Transcript_492:190-756(+)